MMMHRTSSPYTPLLVVDDDRPLLLSIKAALVSAGLPEPALIYDSSQVMEQIRSEPFQVVLLDLIMPEPSGMRLLDQIKEESPGTECIIVTAIDEVSSAVQAMQHGAYDYLVKPIEPERLVITVNRAIEHYQLRHGLAPCRAKSSFATLRNPSVFKDMVAEDEQMATLFHQAEAVAVTDYSLLLTGETGTGKGVLARIIHDLSLRARNPFVRLNMASFSKGLFEAEFFGHVKGAFTGADRERKGLVETAKGGTLYLDEITEMDLDLQAKLLQVVESKELYRLGSSEARSVDVRFLASSNRDVYEELNKGVLRKDLFYRLNMFHIHIPPLRQRKKDILPLVAHFLARYAQENRKDIRSIEPALAERLEGYAFPGNVRELENIIARAVIVERGAVLSVESAPALSVELTALPVPDQAALSLSALESRHIAYVLSLTDGNRTRAAKMLGIGVRTLQRKLGKAGTSQSGQK